MIYFSVCLFSIWLIFKIVVLIINKIYDLRIRKLEKRIEELEKRK